MNPKHRYAPVPVVTDEQVNDYACILAKQDGMKDRRVFNLLRWPCWATPPRGDFADLFAKYVQEFREKARARLEAEAAARPRIRIKRFKRRNKPDRKKYWTRWTTKHGHHPPARRRGYPPLIPAQQTATPPGQKQRLRELPRQERPSRRDDREPLLLFEVPGISGTPDIRRFPNAL